MFWVLPTATVVRTIADLNAHSRIFDLMGFEPSHFNKINIHIGSGADDHDATIARFINNFALLDPTVTTTHIRE